MVLEREREIKVLQERMKTLILENKQILKKLQELKQSQGRLQKLSCYQRDDRFKIEKVISDLLEVPSMFATENNLMMIKICDNMLIS